MTEHRISSGTTLLDYTCQNSRFKTDISKGHPHRPGDTYMGSATPAPIYDDGDSSLWLEHVIEPKKGISCYWFMWYDASGRPLLSQSSVIDERDILQVIKNIGEIKL